MPRKLILLVALLLAIVALFAWLRVASTDEDAQSGVASSDATVPEKKSPTPAASVRPLRPGGVAGIVVTHEGQPVAGASVALLPRSFADAAATQRDTSHRVAMSDEAGAWSFEDVEPGRYGLTATAPRRAPAFVPSIQVHEGDRLEAIELRLEEGGHLVQGTISDAGGGPIEGATVMAVSQEAMVSDGVNEAPAFVTVSADEGGYQLSLRPGVYAMLVEHPDYAPASRVVHVDGGPRTEDFQLVPGASIEGIVRRSTDGEPVAGATIVQETSIAAMREILGIRLRNVAPRGMKSDAAGRFRLAGLSPGIVQLEVFGEDYATYEPTEVAVGIAQSVTGVELWVDPMGRITGVVVWSDTKEAVSGAVVTLTQRASMTIVAADQPTGEDGRFQVSGVPPGKYEVAARGVEIASTDGAEVSVEAGDAASVQLEVERGSTLRGRLEPPGVAQVVASRGSGTGLIDVLSGNTRARASTSAGDDGKFELTGLSPGEYEVTVRTDDGRRGTSDVLVPTSEELVVRLEERSSAAGAVLDTDGRGVSGARVCAAPSGSARKSGANRGLACTHAEADGSFTVRGLVAGTYAFAVWDAASSTKLTLADEAAAAVDVGENETTKGIRLLVSPLDGRVTGTVLDPDQVPLADAWVTLAFQGDRSASEPARARDRHIARWLPAQAPVLVDSDGQFEIDGLVRGRYLVVAQGRGGTLRGEAEVQTDADVVIVTEGVGTISGRVTSGAGPPERFTVRATGPSLTRRSFRGDGSFVLSNLAPGAYVLSARADGLVGRTEVELRPDAEASVEIELDLLGTVEGRAVDGDGNRLEGIAVRVSSDDEEPDITQLLGGAHTTDEDGRFEVSGVVPGKGTVSLHGGSRFDARGAHAFETFEMEAGATVDLGDVVVQSRQERARELYDDHSDDLGLRFYVGEAPPTQEALAAVDADPSSITDHMQNPEAKLWIAAVDPGGVGHESGFRVGDRVIAVGRSPVGGMAFVQLMSLADDWRSKGRPVVWVIERDGETLEIEVVVPE